MSFIDTFAAFSERMKNAPVQAEPPLPQEILGSAADRFRCLRAGATVCIKVSAARNMPYPFTVSPAFITQVVAEIRQANPTLRILLTEGGVGGQSVQEVAASNGLAAIPHSQFIDAEAGPMIFVPNSNPAPYRVDGFHLPAHWVEADIRVLLTTCKLRSHHLQRWYSGGTRNLIGLLPRAHYQLSTSRRAMRSMVHQRGMDAMVADLYTTTGRDLLTILDCRLLARHDEHLPFRFTRSPGKVLVADDPYRADLAMVGALRLPFTPPYLSLIAQATSGHSLALAQNLCRRNPDVTFS